MRPNRKSLVILALAATVALSVAGEANRNARTSRDPGRCSDASSCYQVIATDPSALRSRLAAQYEIGFGATTFGSNVGTAVPWNQVSAWAAAHPELRVLWREVNEGYILTVLSLRGGYAYVQFSPSGRVTKVYLSAGPLAWD